MLYREMELAQMRSQVMLHAAQQRYQMQAALEDHPIHRRRQRRWSRLYHWGCGICLLRKPVPHPRERLLEVLYPMPSSYTPAQS